MWRGISSFSGGSNAIVNTFLLFLQKHMRLTSGGVGGGGGGSPSSPGRRPRSDNKKCRKVYGMDQRDLWCTQCKWKKACTRFGD